MDTPSRLRERLKSGVGLALGGALLGAVGGAWFGIHNTIAERIPFGREGAQLGALIGTIIGAVLALIPPDLRASRRAIFGAVLGAPIGLVFGLYLPRVTVPIGMGSAFAGAAILAVFFVVLRLRALLGLTVLVWLLGIADPDRHRSDPPPAAEMLPIESYDVTPQALGPVEPGLALETGPPEGWSHLIIKTHYQAHSGDVAKFPRGFDVPAALAALFTTLVADVQLHQENGQPPQYRLSRLGLGVGARVKGRDTIVSRVSHRRLGAELNLLTQATLVRHEQRLATIRLMARSNTMAIIDDPTFFFRDGRHRPVVLRFALLVDAATGQLDALVWRIDGNAVEGFHGPIGPIEWLPSPKIERFLLHVDSREFTHGLPVEEKSLAIVRMPAGRVQVEFPPDLRAIAGRVPLTQTEAAELEHGLRQLLRTVTR